eukprot:412194-Ditylum_brightwellii.AAC.1
MEKKTSRILNAVFESNLKVSRDPKKGHLATFSSFVESANLSDGAAGGQCNIALDNKPAVEQLWKHVSPIINCVATKMEPLLNKFGVSSESMSPFCCHFAEASNVLE